MDGELIIGDRVFFNNNCSINCFNNIVIGNDCQFGEGVKFYDVDHNYKEKNALISAQGYNKGVIKIGPNCWFGSNVTILKNVSIGNNVVIGANCVIHECIPSDSVVTNSTELKVKKI
jgi:acetyltransferase-like isoleucine patch superfamily enzyme